MTDLQNVLQEAADLPHFESPEEGAAFILGAASDLHGSAYAVTRDRARMYAEAIRIAAMALRFARDISA
jgi:hypothetical protein